MRLSSYADYAIDTYIERVDWGVCCEDCPEKSYCEKEVDECNYVHNLIDDVVNELRLCFAEVERMYNIH